MTILVTGGTGGLGSELRLFYPECLSPTRTDLDITNNNQVIDYFNNHSINLVIHTAAITSVRLCEEDRQLAWNANVQGTKNLVNAVTKSQNDIKFIYISTACVFDGYGELYKENDIPYPENFYALTKLIGETEVSKIKNHLIIRTNFVSKKPWPYPAAFTDRFGTYLFAETVAKGITEILKEDLNGIIHLVGDKKISMFELAKMTNPNVLPMTMNDYEGPPLTIDMSLDTERWKKYVLK